MGASRQPLLTDLLKQVSRSFYLTMRILPGPVRPQISLAYLLARTTDTIADTEIVPVDGRLQALRAFRERIAGRTGVALEFGELARNQGLPAERVLLDRVEEALGLMKEFSTDDQQRIREVLNTIISGQELDLIRFAHSNEKLILSLQTEAELDGYTYRVAGCVGEFWTKMCCAHLFRGRVDEPFLIQNGIRFGKGLQLVNILRDLPKDLRQGRCYVPKEDLAKAGILPEDLIKGGSSKFQPVYDKYLAQAESHLKAGWDYTNALPKNQRRVRLSCAWPILIGIKTIRKLQNTSVLGSPEPIKISRSEVRQILLGSIAALFSEKRWIKQFDKASGSSKCC